MGEEEQLQEQMAEIGGRFLIRTIDEFEGLEACLRRLVDGDSAARGELIQLVHRIYGSSAMFGFEEISRRAGALEDLARDAKDADRLPGALDELKTAVRTAAGARKLS